MKRLVIILGMHRSGTSLTARLSQCMGAYLGEENELMGASLGNPDGHYENVEVVRINNHILDACDREWYSLETPEPDYDSPQIIREMEELKRVIQRLLKRSDTAVIKDPRISILLPLWDKVLKEIEIKVDYIWVFRNPLEVMESLRKRNGYSSKHGLLLWSHYNLSILKYLQGKKYLLINYKDILGQSQAVEELSGMFRCKFDDLKLELNRIIKYRYCHSNYSYQDILDTQNILLSDLYGALLRKEEAKINVSELEKRYKNAIAKADNSYMDYQVLENMRCLEGKDIIIYGAGKYGRQTAEMLEELGFSKYDFCDKDIDKHGMKILNGRIYTITEIENKGNLLVIIAIENEKIRKEAEQTLSYIEGVQFLSFLH